MSAQDKPDATKREPTQKTQKNEGEGSRTAARSYNERTKEFLDRADVDKLAGDARGSLEGQEGEELRKAEEKGKQRAKGEDPALKRRS